jgi:pyruvate, orthophosphate dikinase
MIGNGKFIYRFGNGATDGDGSMRSELGGKGAGLAEMTLLNIPVPPGFTISTSVCRYYLEHKSLPPGFEQELEAAVTWLEGAVGRAFGDLANPLLVSVRSGAVVSMPGMMDTILNVGLTREHLQGLAAQSGSLRFALDTYRRLLQMYGAVVLEVPKKKFDLVMDSIRPGHAAIASQALSQVELQAIVEQFEQAIRTYTTKDLRLTAERQLSMAINAVFDSWGNERAQFYRRLNEIPDDLGTAVTVQAMVFGNADARSGTGVGFTRNPSTGENIIFGEFLVNAQGEDIVAGSRTPVPVVELANSMPEVYEELSFLTRRLEQHYREVQDFEFTVEKGRLFLLQTRTAKRSALAAVRTAVEMVSEGLITRKQAVARINPASVTEITAQQLDFSLGVPGVIAHGLSASPGAAVGRIALSAAAAVAAAAGRDRDPIILVSQETTADDIHGMAAAIGFLTACGGATSHAAVVARGMGKCCITAAKEIHVDFDAGVLRISDLVFREGDWLSLDASTGRVFAGKLPLQVAETEHKALDTIVGWAIEQGPIRIRANADTPEDASNARASGAFGIGLCRTEHMFFSPERLPHVRAMILASSTEDRKQALEKLLPMQQDDFEELFRAMSSLPVTIRLLDPPLHEFLPSLRETETKLFLAKEAGDLPAVEQLKNLATRIHSLIETNPMMGHRGCRLSISYPEIVEMQVRAILQAALKVAAEGFVPVPEIMIPLVASAEEMRWLRRLIDEVAAESFANHRASIDYSVGTMIELPRAAVCAGAIAQYADFASFGTNDLTQMTFGFSRDDAGKFIDRYIEQGILKGDPFVTLDREGVGALIAMAIKEMRTVKPGIKVGVCGEHGGDPSSIEFFVSAGVDYVSCSPARLPVAQIAVAQTKGIMGKSEQNAVRMPRPSKILANSEYTCREPLA